MKTDGQLKRDLLEMSMACSERGLLHSAKWAAELACAIQADSAAPNATKAASIDPEQHVIQFAKTLFDLKEYDRAAFHLADCVGAKGVFLACYARYLVRYLGI